MECLPEGHSGSKRGVMGRLVKRGAAEEGTVMKVDG